jgi:predicted alpha/beta superfamily hydrolase
MARFWVAVCRIASAEIDRWWRKSTKWSYEMKRSLLKTFLIIGFLPVCLFAQVEVLGQMQGLGDTKTHRIVYKPLDQTYYVYVRLPNEYDPKKQYPTIYLLDGGYTFPMLASYYQYLKFSEEVPEMIVVGISYGTDEREAGNQRSRDFTALSKEREYWGGAGKFSDFFRSTLFPLVEKTYGSDPNKRIVFGQSLGGQYALYAAQAETGLFWGHIASNPALHRNLEYFLKTQPVKEKRVRLYVSSGSNDEPAFFKPAQDWVKHWSQQTVPEWSLKTEILEGQTHFSAAPEAFRRGLVWILKEK